MSYTAPIKDMLFNMEHIAGLEQLTAAYGKESLAVNVFASRHIEQPSNCGQTLLRTAKGGYSV